VTASDKTLSSRQADVEYIRHDDDRDTASLEPVLCSQPHPRGGPGISNLGTARARGPRVVGRR
jgi:hypothetical protein